MKTLTLPSDICEILHVLLLLLALLIFCPARSLAQSFRFETFGDNTMSMLLIQEKAGSTQQFMAKFKGAIQADVFGKVENIEGSIESLQAENADEVKVSKTELKDGTLVISTAQGEKHVIFDIHSNMAGRIRDEATAPGSEVHLARAGETGVPARQP